MGQEKPYKNKNAINNGVRISGRGKKWCMYLGHIVEIFDAYLMYILYRELIILLSKEQNLGTKGQGYHTKIAHTFPRCFTTFPTVIFFMHTLPTWSYTSLGHCPPEAHVALLNILQAKSFSAISAIKNRCFHLPVPQLENVGISARVDVNYFQMFSLYSGEK